MLDARPITDQRRQEDQQRRLSLGLSTEEFARLASITAPQLLQHESLAADHRNDADVATRVGIALEVLEAFPPRRPPTET